MSRVKRVKHPPGQIGPEFIGKRKEGGNGKVAPSNRSVQGDPPGATVIFSKDFVDGDKKSSRHARNENGHVVDCCPELRRSIQRLINEEESFRKNMAELLHGPVQTRLIIVQYCLNKLRGKVLTSEVSAELEVLERLVTELVNDQIRPISHGLYPSILRQGLIPALRMLAAQFEQFFAFQWNISEELFVRERADRNLLPEQTRLAVYRIAEEALANILKHARASTIVVTLGVDKGFLRLTLADDGCGFDTSVVSNGMGISIMDDYAAVVEGSCIVCSTPGSGSQVVALLPVNGLGSGARAMVE